MEIIEGERSGTAFFMFEGYLFKRTRTTYEKVYVTCLDRVCRARGDVLGQDFQLRGEHNHAPPALRIKKLKLRRELRLKACEPRLRRNMRRAFDEACSSNDEAATHLAYPSFRSTMYRELKKGEPPNPSNLKEFAQMLSENEWKHRGLTLEDIPQPFFNVFLDNQDENWEAAVFSSHSLIEIMKSAVELHIDATFKVVPRKFGYQLLTIQFTFMDHMLPAIFVLMTRKSEECYRGVFTYIMTELVPQSSATVKKIMTDYEMGLMNAAATAWTNANTTGCFFHFAWAVYRKHQQLLMTNLTEVNATAKRALKSLMALALLPANKMREGLIVVRSLLSINSLQRQFEELCQYVEDYWLGTVGSERVSVFNQIHRTNNSVEGFHSNLLAKMGPHPGIWQFTDILQKTELSTRKDCERLQYGQDVTAPRRRRQNIQDANIKRAWRFLEEGRYNVTEFLSKCSHTVDGLESRLRGVIPRTQENNEENENPDEVEEMRQDATHEIEHPIPNVGEEDDMVLVSDESEGEREEHQAVNQNVNRQAHPYLGDRVISQGRPYYWRYRTVPTTHKPEEFLPEEITATQVEELKEAVTFGPSEEVSFEADEGQVACSVCLTNAATRMAIPCAHYIVCRECLPAFINQTIFYTVTGPGGQVVSTPIRQPITCPDCRAIVGQVIPTY